MNLVKMNLEIIQSIASVLRRAQLNCAAFSTKSRPEGSPSDNSLSSHRRLKSVTDSLANRGFLRSYKAYSPPENVSEAITKLLSTLDLTASSKLTDVSIKFELLKSCTSSFDHQVPNSMLHEIRNVQDVIEFYSTPVDTTLPMDRIQNIPDLPKNLHIQQEYVRYSPEDPFFETTAFPKSSTLVSGIQTRRKYKGHQAKRSWY